MTLPTLHLQYTHRMTVVPIKPIISIDDLEKVDIGYADKITPVLATPEKPVPNGTRAG